MIASRATFVKRILALRNFLESQKLQGNLLAMKLEGLGEGAAVLTDVVRRLQSHSLANRVDRAVLDYKSAIISLYGALESLAEGLAVEFVSFLNNTVPRFNALPEVIKENHSRLSAELLLELKKTEKYSGTVTEEQIVRSLYACQTTRMRYALNAEAYTRHSSNFRIGSLMELFRQVGITNLSQRLRLDSKFSEHYQRANPVRNYEHLSDEQVFEFLDDLASRRNDIAHGAEDPNDILSNELLAEMLDKLEVFGEVLCDIVECSKLPFICDHRAVALPKAIKVFNNTIVCFELEQLAVQRGDYLLCANDRNEYHVGEILEIRVDDRSFGRLSIETNPIKVALRVGCRVKESYRFFFLPCSETVEQRFQGDGWTMMMPVVMAAPLTDELVKLFRFEGRTRAQRRLLLPAPAPIPLLLHLARNVGN